MSTLYLDCARGARKESFAVGVGMLLAPEERARIAQAVGIQDVPADHCCDDPDCHHHHHHGVEEVQAKIRAKGLSAAAEAAALGVYEVLAQAEAKAHGVPVAEVHFHEVGSEEAIAWVCIACASVVAIAPDEVVASPVCTGFGTVDCAHGTLPIPAPATANVLGAAGAPTYPGDMEGELTTPTGAALVAYFASRFREEVPAGSLIAQVG